MCLFGNTRSKKVKGTEKRNSIVCPYCMRTVRPEEILFMSNQGETLDEEFVTFASQYQSGDKFSKIVGQSHNHTGQIIQQSDNEFTVGISEETGFPYKLTRQLVGGKESSYSDRLCPHCHCYLPTDIESMELRNIVLLGNTSCGKTSLLAAILHEMSINAASNLSATLGQIKIERDSMPFVEFIIDNWKSASREPTPMIHVFPIVLRVSSVDGRRQTLVAIHDFAGEGMRDLTYFFDHPISQGTVDGVMLVLDVCQLEAYRRRNIQYACEVPVTQCLSEFSREAKKKLRKIESVAVVLNKFDALSLNQGDSNRARTRAYMPGLEEHRDAVHVATIKDVANSVKKILNDDSPANIKSIETAFDRHSTPSTSLDSIEYFATSSMQVEKQEGENATYVNVYEASRQLHRVQEPMLYFMARWGIFPTK